MINLMNVKVMEFNTDIFLKNSIQGTEKTTLWSEALADPPGNSSSISSIHIGQLKYTANSNPGGSMPSSGFQAHCMHMVHMVHIPALRHTHTHRIKESLETISFKTAQERKFK